MSDRPLWRLVAGKKMGPYALEKLRPLVKDGRISPLDRFSYDGESWAPVPAFPELLREPAAAVPPPKDETFSVDLTDGVTPEDDFRPSVPVDGDDDEDDEATRRLLKMVKWMVGVGGGLIALLLLLTVFTTVRAGRAGRAEPAVTQSDPSPPVIAAPKPAAENVTSGDEEAAPDVATDEPAPGPKEETVSPAALDDDKSGRDADASRNTAEAVENGAVPVAGDVPSPE